MDPQSQGHSFFLSSEGEVYSQWPSCSDAVYGGYVHFVEPVLEISHIDDDLFPGPDSPLVSISYLPGMGLGRRQHGPSEFIAIPDHDIPFGLKIHPHRGRLSLYGAIARLLVRELESHAPSDGIIGGLSTTQEIVQPMTLCFSDEINEHETFAEIGDIVDGVVHVTSRPTPKIAEDVIVVDVLFDGPVGLVEGASDFVDPPHSFDVLSGFVSRHDYVSDFSSMDLSIFEYLLVCYVIALSAPSSPTSQIFDIDDEVAQHDSDDDSSSVSDSNPVDQRVSPATGDIKIIDFSTVDQPRELRIGSDLSTDERDNLIQLLRAYLDFFAWSYEDMPGLDHLLFSIVCHFCSMPDDYTQKVLFCSL
ncbi:hypothetical protein CK203_046461 [Vitis vinifera]|uniref:Uncharacterized protein n=1 Tax=Vitis vinifera TaxID=29760 RepID=A0A438I1V5_VITVI|nr:hypothetical protein CK203_046461 [Vitis vinifera]